MQVSLGKRSRLGPRAKHRQTAAGLMTQALGRQRGIPVGLSGSDGRTIADGGNRLIVLVDHDDRSLLGRLGWRCLEVTGEDRGDLHAGAEGRQDHPRAEQAVLTVTHKIVIAPWPFS